jgi:hypothetical protein
MKKSNKILLGLATLWPFLYLILFFVFIFASFIFMPAQQGEQSGLPVAFGVLFAIHFLTMFWIIGLTIFYMVNVFRNDQVDKDKKVLWAVVIFLGNMIAMPVYWYLYIWKEPSIGNLSAPRAVGSANVTSWTQETGPSNRDEYVPPPQPPNWRE